MLPEYKAIAFDRIIDKGGRTKPWSVLVDTGNSVRPYVVKMFTTQLIENRDSVTNEILGNLLARSFDLPVPEAALIHMDESFRQTIHSTEAQMAYDQADERMKFGSAFMQGNYLFNSDFTKVQAGKMVDLDTLFAFDNLIRNRDRNRAKPNLLVKGRSAFLIDHELGFEIDATTLAKYQNGEWDKAFYENHIFWNYLKRSRKYTKRHYFSSFQEYLKRLPVNNLTSYFKQLVNNGYDPARQAVIRDYLYAMKKNPTTFVDLLKSFI
jgi:hypothetical protein